MRVMAVGAHPDDLEILCGGTLARYAREGDDVTMCSVARGDRGSFVHSQEEIAEVRDREARAAATLIDADYLALGVSDGEIDSSNEEQRRLMTDAIRKARPDVLLTHSPNDYMPDHNEAGKLAFDASFLSTLRLYETDSQVHAQVPALIYIETMAGNDFIPTEFVDISADIETKVAMLSQHASQLSWLKDHDGVDMVDQIRTVSRFRGLQCGVDHAEGFVPCNVWLRARPRRLLP